MFCKHVRPAHSARRPTVANPGVLAAAPSRTAKRPAPMAATKTFHLVALLLAACLMASPALASRHLTQDPTVTPGTSPVPAEGAALPGAGDLTSMNSTAGGNETSIEQCMMLLESYNITLVNATTNETLSNTSTAGGIGEAARSGRRTGGFGSRSDCRGSSGNPALDCN